MPLPVESDILCSLVIAIRSSITVCVLKIKFYITEFIFKALLSHSHLAI